MIEVSHPKWLKPTDGNLYVDRSHPPVNVGFTPIKFYERRTTVTPPAPQVYQRDTGTIDDRADTAGKPYFSTTFFSQFTEGPRYGSTTYVPKPESLYH